jgi:pyroglutamyl-peptidase
LFNSYSTLSDIKDSLCDGGLILKKILLTGFAAFGPWTENPSFAAVKSFAGQIIQNYLIVAEQLPVDYVQLSELIKSYIAAYCPSIVLMFGIAEGISAIRVEKVAINEATAHIPYTSGHQPVEEKIVPSGPAAYFTGLPARNLVAELKKNGVPAEISYSAGTYACNQAFYCLMNQLEIYNSEKMSPIYGGFIHIPITPNMVAAASGKSSPSMTLELVIQAVKIIITQTIYAVEQKNNSKL